METPAFDLSALVPGRPPGDDHGAPIQITDDLAWLRCGIVNVAFLGHPDAGDRGWVLVDAGLPGFAGTIARAAEARFGGSRPAAIVLTHGHFDHVGALRDLADRWDVPVYAHHLELPYLTGKSAYPPPDPTVGGGAMAFSSPLFPPGPFDFGDRVRRLPTGAGDDDTSGAVPNAGEWQWRHTPGHAPGHVSLWRERDRALVAGDAFVTTKQESAVAVYEQRLEIHGPPMYYTPDWDAARASVAQLAELAPEVAVTGHGLPMSGAALRDGLRALARDFDVVARPARGRYVREPARMDDAGVRSLPPAVPDAAPLTLVGGALAAGVLLGSVGRRR
ncbi:MBL fold metallo-hydrolase [Gemmatimonadetes bacterium T265]|nr:MBL fold metallo-hydrolase [Gemmatimonadetes bacterium T265]